MATTTLQNWQARYRDGDTPWDTQRPSSQLTAIVESGEIAPGRALELGCGIGTNAIYLARRGFDLTAVDFVEQAVETAREKVEQQSVFCRFVVADVLALPDLGGPFDFVFDRGCFHVVRRIDEAAAVRAIAAQLRPAGRLLIMTGNAKEKMEPGPPVVSEDELRSAFSASFDIEWLRECRFDPSPADDGQPLAWIAMMRRR